MTVYVDDARNPLGRMVMSHMAADTTAELREMAKAIGVDPVYVHRPGMPGEHLDVSQSKRAEAISRGAIAVDQKFMVGLRRAKRG